MNIAEVKSLPDGSAIPSITGRVIAAYPPKTGTSSRGPYSFQDLVIQDDSGSIKVSVQQPGAAPVESSTKGQLLTISSKSGSKGLSGVYAEDHDYNGSVTRRIKVTPTGSIVVGGQQHAPKGSHREKLNLLTIGAKFSAAYLFALDCADKIAEARAQDGKPLTPEQFQALTATAFINMEKMGLLDAVSVKVASQPEPSPVQQGDDDEIPL